MNESKIPKFRRCVIQNFPFIEEDFDALTDYQLLCKVVEYLNKVIDKTNQYDGEINTLKIAYEQLKTYVDTYFDNLDVQEEINNKLDEMVESGVMEQLITEFFMCQDLDVSGNFGITSTKTVDSETPLIYHITRIHANPEKIDHVPLKGYFAGGSFSAAEDTTEKLIDMAKNVNAVFISNASAAVTETRTWIRDGQVVSDNYTSDSKMIAQTQSGDLMLYDNTYTAEELINTYHVENSWISHGEIIVDGVLDSSNWYEQSLIEPNVVNNRHPRTGIFQLNDDKDIYFIHVEGRKPSSAGVTFMEFGSLVKTLYPNVRILVNFGGGGDSQLVLKGEYKNDCTDAQLRKLHDCIYLNPNIEEDTYNTYENEIADGRNVTNTLHELLTTFLPYNKNYLTARTILTAEHIVDNDFVCNLDYNTSLNVGESVLIQFGDMDEEGVSDSNDVRVNIHSGDGGQVKVLFATGQPARPVQLRNRIVIAKWTGSNYVIQTNHIFANNVYADTSLNDLTEGGLYYSGSFTDKPVNEGGWLVVVPHSTNPNYYFQVFVTRPSGKIYYRIIENGVAGDWKHIVNESDIIPSAVENIQNLDADDIVGKLRFCYGNDITNKPTSSANGWLINIPYLTGSNVSNYGQQIFMERYTDSSHGRIFIRTLENGTWSSWRQLAFAA